MAVCSSDAGLERCGHMTASFLPVLMVFKCWDRSELYLNFDPIQTDVCSTKEPGDAVEERPTPEESQV